MSVAGPGRYESIGAGYARRRQTEPRIAARIEAALGDARTVLNVGAGSGSYEPANCDVVALEPSLTMIRQRRVGGPPVVRGAAECLPFRDNSFDAAMGVLTLHHWIDWRAGVREMRRVAPRRVLLAYEPAISMEFWLLTEYFPALRALEVGRPAIDDVAESLGADRVEPILVPHDCMDGFLGANWRRPEGYLDPAIRAANSSFGLVEPALLDEGIARLAVDVESGEWHRRHADLLGLESADLGYRLLVSG